MAIMSPAIPITASTPVAFNFSNYRTSTNITIFFFTDADGRVALTLRGTGSRDVVTTTTTTAFETESSSPEPTLTLESDIFGGNVTGMPDGQLRQFEHGAGMKNIKLVAAPDVNGAAASYRIFADAQGVCVLG